MSEKKGKRLFAVGVGPGDPELLTLKAVRILRETGTIAVPRGRENGVSLALGIIGKAVDLTGKTIIDIHFPMSRNVGAEALKPAAGRILDVLRNGEDAAFVTLGDPAVYSTFFRLREAILLLDPAVRIEIVPGVTSVTAAAAAAGRRLTISGEKLAVLPAFCRDDLIDILSRFETVCIMKAGSAFREIKKMLEEAGLAEDAVCVSRTGMQGEFVRAVTDINNDFWGLDYFSTIIVSGRGRKAGK